jgi:hypothetical protein
MKTWKHRNKKGCRAGPPERPPRKRRTTDGRGGSKKSRRIAAEGKLPGKIPLDSGARHAAACCPRGRHSRGRMRPSPSSPSCRRRRAVSLPPLVEQLSGPTQGLRRGHARGGRRREDRCTGRGGRGAGGRGRRRGRGARGLAAEAARRPQPPQVLLLLPLRLLLQRLLVLKLPPLLVQQELLLLLLAAGARPRGVCSSRRRLLLRLRGRGRCRPGSRCCCCCCGGGGRGRRARPRSSGPRGPGTSAHARSAPAASLLRRLRRSPAILWFFGFFHLFESGERKVRKSC